METESMLPRLLTTRQLAAATGLPVWRIHELCTTGKGPPFIWVGRTRRFAEDAVVAWIKEQSNANKEMGR